MKLDSFGKVIKALTFVTIKVFLYNCYQALFASLTSVSSSKYIYDQRTSKFELKSSIKIPGETITY